MTIVPMAQEHLASVEAIGRACFSLPWCVEGYWRELQKEGSICLAALEGEQVAGFLCAATVLDEGDIELVAVQPGQRRKGVARALLEELCCRCRERGIVCLHLEVRASNQAAIRLYESGGFSKDGCRKDYYRLPKEDALLYSLSLSAGNGEGAGQSITE